jgi:hypothetical protein
MVFDDSGLLIDSADYPLGAAAVSWCRVPDGTGFLKTCKAQTLGRTNAGQ